MDEKKEYKLSAKEKESLKKMKSDWKRDNTKDSYISLEPERMNFAIGVYENIEKGQKKNE